MFAHISSSSRCSSRRTSGRTCGTAVRSQVSKFVSAILILKSDRIHHIQNCFSVFCCGIAHYDSPGPENPDFTCCALLMSFRVAPVCCSLVNTCSCIFVCWSSGFALLVFFSVFVCPSYSFFFGEEAFYNFGAGIALTV